MQFLHLFESLVIYNMHSLDFYLLLKNSYDLFMASFVVYS